MKSIEDSRIYLKRLQHCFSKSKKAAKNRAKFRNKLSRQHLKVSRQRKEFAVKTARCVVKVSRVAKRGSPKSDLWNSLRSFDTPNQWWEDVNFAYSASFVLTHPEFPSYETSLLSHQTH